MGTGASRRSGTGVLCNGCSISADSVACYLNPIDQPMPCDAWRFVGANRAGINHRDRVSAIEGNGRVGGRHGQARGRCDLVLGEGLTRGDCGGTKSDREDGTRVERRE